MGNNYDPKKENFYMHLKFIGLNIQKFYNNLKNTPSLHDIIKLWEIEPLENINSLDQINSYFNFLEEKRNDDNNKDLSLRECLIIKLNNVFDPEMNYIYEKMNKLSSKQFMPLVLILTKEISNKEIVIDTEKYEDIDPRFFFFENYTEDKDEIDKKIAPIILRFCSIHNELGDFFSLNKSQKDEEKFVLIEKAFPFNLNIVCIGRFGQGKSTGANQILQEYKAKESNKGCSQTKNMIFYQVKNKPIRILDVPGFESEKTVQNTLAKFKEFRDKLKKLKDSIHIILYFLNYTEERSFMELEYQILEEISKHESAQLIYVITHSRCQNPSQKSKGKILDRINSGIQGITKNKQIKKEKLEMFKASENNVVFVNFHQDEDLQIEPFGKKELFKKIHDFFVSSKDYKDSLKELSSKEKIEKKALILRAQAERLLLPNKIWGGAVGIIPFADWALQKFVIKKNVLKKVGEIFGFDIKFMDEDIENQKKLKIMNEKKENDIHYNASELINKENKPYVIGNKLNKETDEFIVHKSVECTIQTSKYAGGVFGVNTGINATTQAVKLTTEAAQFTSQATQLATEAAQYSTQAAQLTTQAAQFSTQATQLTTQAAQYSAQAAQYTAKAAKMAEEANNYSKFLNFFTGTGSALSKEAANIGAQASNLESLATSIGAQASNYASKATNIGAQASNFASKAASTEAAAAESTTIGLLGKYGGIGLLGLGIIVGVSCGAYFTHKFCEETLDKFVEYYKNNSHKIKNSYEEAANYFLNN